MVQDSTQTTCRDLIDRQMQTEKEGLGLMDFLNHSLGTLNAMTTSNQSSVELAIIENIHSALRREKISLINRTSKSSTDNFQYPLTSNEPFNYSRTDTSPVAPFSYMHREDHHESLLSGEQPTQILKLVDKSDIELEGARTPSPKKAIYSSPPWKVIT